MSEVVKFDCTVAKNLFFKDDYKIYSVFVDTNKFPDIVLDKTYNTAKIVGSNIYELDLKTVYHVTATPQEHPKYGISYSVISISTDQPQSESDVRSYLQTILTPNQAYQLMTHYPNIIDIVKEDRIAEIDFSKLKGITPKKFENIKEKIMNNFALIDVCATFYNMITLSVMQKLYNQFGSIGKIVETLKEQPYTSLYRLDRIGFKKADEILLKIEEESNRQIKEGTVPKFQFKYSLKSSSNRCLACMQYYLELNEQDGNTKMSVSDLKAKIVAYATEASMFFDSLLENDCFYYDKTEQVIGLYETYQAEQYIANKIVNANKKPILWDFDLSKYTKLGQFNLTEHQQNAQRFLCKNNVVILNGGAGTGKTSSVKSLVNMLKDYNISFAMSAPSAKAAKVLTKYSGFQATTIHRMLGYENGSFIHNSSNPLPYGVVIIDETSMLDVWLMKNVLSAIDFQRTKLLLVGDSYQLPSVGAGNLFHDLLQSNICPISTLNEIFRYSEGGLIKVATDTRNSQKFLPDKIDLKKPVISFGDSYFFCPQSKENCVNYVVKMYQKLAETNECEDIMVITAQNKGEYGAIVLNNKIQEAINPNTEEVISYTTSDDITVEYRHNDIVMQTVNDYHSIICNEYGNYDVDDDGKPLYETLIANGENGRITHITKQGMVVRYDNYYIWRTKADLEKMMLGYAMTCHKSQGSGCKNVIVLTPSAHTFMLNSNLLYVALTRSKAKCFHIGNLHTVNSTIKKKQNLSRKTFLQQLIKKEKERLT